MKEAGGYIHVKGWEEFQHPDVKRRASPGAAWIKLYVDLLDNPEYIDLSPHDRAVLHGLHMLTARTGQGRVSARPTHVQHALNIRACHVHRTLQRLSDAGFIEVRASRAQAVRKHYASPEVEGSKEPQKEKKNAHARDSAEGVAASAQNGHQNSSDDEQPLTKEEAQRLLAEVQAKIGIKPILGDL